MKRTIEGIGATETNVILVLPWTTPVDPAYAGLHL